jgi:hypothetical protein
MAHPCAPRLRAAARWRADAAVRRRLARPAAAAAVSQCLEALRRTFCVALRSGAPPESGAPVKSTLRDASPGPVLRLGWCAARSRCPASRGAVDVRNRRSLALGRLSLSRASSGFRPRATRRAPWRRAAASKRHLRCVRGAARRALRAVEPARGSRSRLGRLSRSCCASGRPACAAAPRARRRGRAHAHRPR